MVHLQTLGYDRDDDYSQWIGISYLVGVYVALNAIRDAYLLMEGPNCTYMKLQFVQGSHDFNSTLSSVSGFHRVWNTDLFPSMLVNSREGEILKSLLHLAEHETVPGLILTSMPMASITGADYIKICQEVREQTGKQVINVRGLSLQGDWLDGYAETLLSFAKQLDLPEIQDRKETDVAIVGHMWDRNEWDSHANVREIKNMLEALGLNVVSIWFSGQKFHDLENIARAGTILALPYGRKAARAVARRLKAKVVELPTPFGINACEEWMRSLGEHFGVQERAEAYIDQELADIIPRLEWVLPLAFQNISTAYVGDPHLLPGFIDIIELLGGNFSFGVITNKAKHTAFIGDLLEKYPVLIDPKQKSLDLFVREHMEGRNCPRLRLVAANCMGDRIVRDSALMEFGFPTLNRHVLYDRPFLGFRGFLAFVDDAFNALRRSELEAYRNAMHGSHDHRGNGDPREGDRDGDGDRDRGHGGDRDRGRDRDRGAVAAGSEKPVTETGPVAVHP